LRITSIKNYVIAKTPASFQSHLPSLVVVGRADIYWHDWLDAH
jgi:hypothetical protein